MILLTISAVWVIPIFWITLEMKKGSVKCQDDEGFHEIIGDNVMHNVPKVESKAPTEFFVSEECNGCGLCKSIAPEFFDCVDYAYSYFLTRQPRTQSEINLLKDAASFCVLDAIRETAKSHPKETFGESDA